MLPDEILHHINVVHPGRREPFMPVMQGTAAAGQETGKILVPFTFGVPVCEGDILLFYAMLYNPTGRPKRVTVEARLQYEISGGLDRFDVQPFYLDIDGGTALPGEWGPARRQVEGGGMAGIAGVGWPQGRWPAPDPGDPLFRKDCRHFLRANPDLRDLLCPEANASLQADGGLYELDP